MLSSISPVRMTEHIDQKDKQYKRHSKAGRGSPKSGPPVPHHLWLQIPKRKISLPSPLDPPAIPPPQVTRDPLFPLTAPSEVPLLVWFPIGCFGGRTAARSLGSAAVASERPGSSTDTWGQSAATRVGGERRRTGSQLFASLRSRMGDDGLRLVPATATHVPLCPIKS